jgi:Carboxypeptidase regulatory-like domain/TonB dependent receptor-like, beta-barrel
MKSSVKLLMVIFLGVFSYLATSSMALAQGGGAGTILGTVHDPSGAVVPGATIAVRDTAKGLVVRTLTSSSEGRYVAPFLIPSTYDITVEHAGFAKLVRSGIDLRVGDSLEIDLALQVSASTQVVTVTEAAPLLETTKTESSQTMGKAMVENLPIDGHRWDRLALLTPGVTNDGDYGLVSFRGISGLYNNNMVDGANNNQAFFSEARGRTRVAYSYSMDSIQEFQVTDSNFSPDFGQAAGGLVNAVTKSGTNQWHGDAFEYLRQFKMDALDPLSKSRGVDVKPVKTQNQFGGSAGGPLIKDKLFFFGTYDGFRKSFPFAVVTYDAKFFSVPCPAAASANQCSAARGFLQSQEGKFPRQGNQDIYFSKFDYEISANNRLTGGLNWHNWTAPNGYLTSTSITSSNQANGLDAVRDRFLVLRLSTALSSNLANEFVFQYGKDLEFDTTNAPGPSVSIYNGPTYGETSALPRPEFPDERRWQFTDNVSLIHGSHTLKAGFDLNAIHEVLANLYQGGGAYSYTGTSTTAFQSYVLDVFGIDAGDGKTGKHYNSFVQAYDPITGVGKDDFWNKDYAAYLQDSWKARRNITINLGLRYDVQAIPQPPKPNTASPLLTLYTSTIKVAKNHFGPRIGIAWQPTAKTVVRLGYGLAFAKTSNSTFYDTRVENGVYQITYSCKATSSCAPTFPNLIFTPPGPTPAAPFAGALTPQVVNTNPTATTTVLHGQSPDFTNPLVHMGELTIQRQLPGQTMVTASYLFSRGQRLPVFVDSNLAPATSTNSYDVIDSAGNTLQRITLPFYTNRLNPSVGAILTGNSVLNSWYHALVISVRRNYSHGIALLANYTYSKTIDDGQTIGTYGTFSGTDIPLDPYNQRLEYGLSDLDQRNRFVVSTIWDPPSGGITNRPLHAILNGFRFSGTGTFSAGFPVTGTVSGYPSGLDWGLTGGEISAYGTSTGGRIPYVGRNTSPGPPLKVVDFRVARQFKLSERFTLDMLWEAFNLFNHTNVTDVNYTAAYYDAAGKYACGGHTNACLEPNASFLTPYATGNTLYGARQMQVSMKLSF